MKTSIEQISPELAQEYLARNIKGNRPIRKTWINELSRRMTEGEWKLSPQGISFDIYGRLNDGQHRLFAIIKSGMTVPMLVVYGVDEEVFSVLDDGKHRNISDHLRIPRAHADVSNFLARISTSNNQASQTVVNKYYQAFRPFLEILSNSCNTMRKTFSAAPVKSAAVVSMLKHNNDSYALYAPEVYRQLVLAQVDDPKMPRIAKALVRQSMSGLVTGSGLGQRDLFVRCLYVFDPHKADLSKIQIKDGGIENEICEVRSYLNELIA